jgi:N-acetylneuraminic acid mutarotase
MLTGRNQHASTVLNGKIYVFGGQNDTTGVLNSVEEYDPATDVWTSRAPMPTPRYTLAACALEQSIYVLGGQGAFNVMEVYDPVADSWSTRNALPQDCTNCRCATLDSKLYAVLWVSQPEGGVLPTAAEYDPVGDSWIIETSYATTTAEGRSGAAATAFDGQLLLLGGSVGSSGTATNLPGVLSYDPAADSWGELPPMSLGRSALAAAATENGLFAIGGSNQQTTTGAFVEAYDLTSNAWSEKSGLPIYILMNHTAETEVGLVYVIGGDAQISGDQSTVSTAVNSVFSYDPASEP